MTTIMDVGFVLVALLLGVAFFLYAWGEWQSKSQAERRTTVHELVAAAEQLLISNEKKLDYVLTTLHQRYPRLPMVLLRQMVEAAVFQMKSQAKK